MSKLNLSLAKEGMILGEPIYSYVSGKLLLNTGIRLTKKLITMLDDNRVEVIDVLERYSLFITPAETMANFLDKTLEIKLKEIAPHIIEANTSDNMVEVSKKAIKISKKLLDDELILDICVQMKLTDNKHLFQHSINVCALSLLIAGAMNLNETEMFNISAGALLHDMGMCEMPFLINLKEISGQQLLLWKEHPTYGYYFANEKGIPKEISEIILHHHEHWNGTGFPQKLEGEKIPLGARIVNICCEYDELITLKDQHPYEAIEHLYGAGGIYFDQEIVKIFTNNIAVYPLGSIVKLTTGEIGIVVNVRQNLGPRPIIKVYYNHMNKPITSLKTIDLAKEKTIFIDEVLT